VNVSSRTPRGHVRSRKENFHRSVAHMNVRVGSAEIGEEVARTIRGNDYESDDVVEIENRSDECVPVLVLGVIHRI
jgi:hypothetical protein